jgi:transposase-like protein
MATEQQPRTLLEAVNYFSDKDVALNFVAALRWPDGMACVECGSENVGFLKTRRLWKCRDCKRQFSAKVGTIFEDSPIGLEKWLPAMWMLVNMKNGCSSYELGRALGVTQKTAWFMLHRIRAAMQSKTFKKFGGKVEADETFIGGRGENMHPHKRKRVFQGGAGPKGKAMVLGILQRTSEDGPSQVAAEVAKNRGRVRVMMHLRKHVALKPDTTLYTDELPSYGKGKFAFRDEHIHKIINHARAYVDGDIHTNGMENFWSLLKRTLGGTYVSVDPFHLFRYLDEQVFRFNHRKDSDLGRFVSALKGVLDKRLTYEVLTGRGSAQTA